MIPHIVQTARDATSAFSRHALPTFCISFALLEIRAQGKDRVRRPHPGFSCGEVVLNAATMSRPFGPETHRASLPKALRLITDFVLVTGFPLPPSSLPKRGLLRLSQHRGRPDPNDFTVPPNNSVRPSPAIPTGVTAPAPNVCTNGLLPLVGKDWRELCSLLPTGPAPILIFCDRGWTGFWVNFARSGFTFVGRSGVNRGLLVGGITSQAKRRRVGFSRSVTYRELPDTDAGDMRRITLRLISALRAYGPPRIAPVPIPATMLCEPILAAGGSRRALDPTKSATGTRSSLLTTCTTATGPGRFF